MGWPEKAYWTAFSAYLYSRDKAVPFLPAERLHAMQNRRVRSIVAHAYGTVPFYRRAMDERGLRPADFRSAEDLARLPLIGGGELCADPGDFLSTAVASRPLLELSTSGSSGHSKRILWDSAAVFRFRAAGRRLRTVVARLAGPAAGRRELRFLRSGGSADLFEAFYRRHSWIRPGAGDEQRTASLAEPFSASLDVLNDFRPSVVSGFGAHLGALLRWAHENHLPIWRPKAVVYGGDTMRAEDRRLIEERLGVPVVASYQCCESWRVGFECERRSGYHLSIDQTALRLADEGGGTLRAGEPGRVVISNLTNRATVLLNYELGDLATMATAPCPCGRTLPLLAQLDGRADDFVRTPSGGLVHESLILGRVYPVPGVAMFQLTQNSLESFTMLVVASPGAPWEAMRRGLAESLTALLGPVRLDITQVDDIAREPSGKFKSIKSYVTA